MPIETDKERGYMMERRQLKIWVEPALAEAFGNVCASAKTSMAKEISGFMAQRVGRGVPTGASRIATRKDRRMAIRRIIAELEAVRDAEGRYMDNIPVNLQGGAAYEAAGETVEAIEQAIAALEDSF
jgi:hypothetical protein